MTKANQQEQGGEGRQPKGEGRGEVKRSWLIRLVAKWASSRVCRAVRRLGRTLNKLIIGAGALIDAGTPPPRP